MKQNFVMKFSPHVLFANKNADRRSSREPPVLPDKMQLGLYIIDEQGHVMRQIKVTHFENKRVT